MFQFYTQKNRHRIQLQKFSFVPFTFDFRFKMCPNRNVLEILFYYIAKKYDNVSALAPLQSL